MQENLERFKSLTKRSIDDCLGKLDYRICDVRRTYDPDRHRLRQTLARISLSIDYSAWAKKLNKIDRLESPEAPRTAPTGTAKFAEEHKTKHKTDLKAAVLAGTKSRLIGQYLKNPAASLIVLYSYDALRSVQTSDLKVVSQLFRQDGKIVSCMGSDEQSWAINCLGKYEQALPSTVIADRSGYSGFLAEQQAPRNSTNANTRSSMTDHTISQNMSVADRRADRPQPCEMLTFPSQNDNPSDNIVYTNQPPISRLPDQSQSEISYGPETTNWSTASLATLPSHHVPLVTESTNNMQIPSSMPNNHRNPDNENSDHDFQNGKVNRYLTIFS